MGQTDTLTRATEAGRSPSGLTIPALVLTTVTAALAMSIANVALPRLASDFGVSMATSQWVTLSYLLASTVLIVLIGRLADMWGRGRVLLAGIGLFAAASLGAGLTPGFWELVAARALQGVAAAAMTALPMAMVRETVPAGRVGRTMGLLGSSMAVGMALGPTLGGFVVGGAGWRWVFFLLVPLAVGALSLAVAGLPHAPSGQGGRGRFDTFGLATMAIVLASYSLAVTLRPGGIAGTIGLLALAAIAGAAFLAVERRAAAPLVDLGLVRDAGLLPGLALAFLVAFIMMTFTVVPPFYLTQGLGLESGAMGLAMAAGPVVAILAGVPSGRLVDRIGPARVAMLGLALLTAAALGFVTVPALLGLAGFLVFAVTLTPGNQLFMAANNTDVMARAGGAHQGSVSGMLNLARNLGFVSGTPVMGVVYESAAANAGGPAGALLGLQATFALAAVAGVAALLIGRSAYRRGGRGTNTEVDAT